MAKTKKQVTNVKFMKDFMENGGAQPITQGFVLQAMTEFCKSVVAYETDEECAERAKTERGMVSPVLWRNIAVDFLERYKENYGYDILAEIEQERQAESTEEA